jgi:hypothetical protein
MRTRKAGRLPNLFIMAGDHAWDRARSKPAGSALVLPRDESFDAFDWRCVHGLSVTLVWWNGDPATIDAFARHLIHAGAEMVAALGAQHDGYGVTSCQPTFYRLAPAQLEAA